MIVTILIYILSEMFDQDQKLHLESVIMYLTKLENMIGFVLVL